MEISIGDLALGVGDRVHCFATLSPGQAMEGGLHSYSFKFRKALPLLSLSVALPFSSYTISQDHPYPVSTSALWTDALASSGELVMLGPFVILYPTYSYSVILAMLNFSLEDSTVGTIPSCLSPQVAIPHSPCNQALLTPLALSLLSPLEGHPGVQMSGSKTFPH